MQRLTWLVFPALLPLLACHRVTDDVSGGLLGNVVEVLRLNTVGGIAPIGVCDPQATPTVAVPYQADYVFING